MPPNKFRRVQRDDKPGRSPPRPPQNNFGPFRPKAPRRDSKGAELLQVLLLQTESRGRSGSLGTGRSCYLFSREKASSPAPGKAPRPGLCCREGPSQQPPGGSLSESFALPCVRRTWPARLPWRAAPVSARVGAWSGAPARLAPPEGPRGSTLAGPAPGGGLGPWLSGGGRLPNQAERGGWRGKRLLGAPRACVVRLFTHSVYTSPHPGGSRLRESPSCPFPSLSSKKPWMIPGWEGSSAIQNKTKKSNHWRSGTGEKGKKIIVWLIKHFYLAMLM